MVNSFLPYLRLTVKIFQFLGLSTKFLTVLRLSVNPIKTLIIAGGDYYSREAIILNIAHWKLCSK